MAVLTARSATIAVAIALLLGGCVQSDRGSPSLELHRVQPSTREITPAFLFFMGQFKNDRSPFATPADLAAAADAVVVGTIVAVRPGQSSAPAVESDPVVATSVLEVKVESIVRQDLEVARAGSVYVEVPHPAYVGPGEAGPTGEGTDERHPFDHAAFAATVPRAYGVFFSTIEHRSHTGTRSWRRALADQPAPGSRPRTFKVS